MYDLVALFKNDVNFLLHIPDMLYKVHNNLKVDISVISLGEFKKYTFYEAFLIAAETREAAFIQLLMATMASNFVPHHFWIISS